MKTLTLLGLICFFATAESAKSPKATEKGTETQRVAVESVKEDVAKSSDSAVGSGAATSPAAPATGQRVIDSLHREIRRERNYLSRQLSSGVSEDDINHYKELSRRMGVDIGIWVPYGDFAKEFASAPMIGIHFTWEAIKPLNFTVATYHASAPRNSGPHLGRLSASSIAMGVNAIIEMGRTIPYFRLEACFDFNDVSLGSVYVTSGGDSTITTLGANVGFGVDFIVGREVSFGLLAFYHYAVPKKVTLSDTTQFDLGSSYLSTGLRITF